MAKSALLEHVRQICRVKHFSLKTERAYLTWIKRFIIFNNKRHPKEMKEIEISEYLTFLADKANVSASTQNQALSAILFLPVNASPRSDEWLRVLPGLPWI